MIDPQLFKQICDYMIENKTSISFTVKKMNKMSSATFYKNISKEQKLEINNIRHSHTKYGMYSRFKSK